MLFIHIAGDPSDGSTLSCGVTTLEKDDHSLACLFQVRLQLEQFYLPGLEFTFPVAAADGAHGACRVSGDELSDRRRKIDGDELVLIVAAGHLLVGEIVGHLVCGI